LVINFVFRFAVLICLGLVIASCVSNIKPPNASDFVVMLQLSDLQGLYQNQGESGIACDKDPLTLSSIFVQDNGFSHDSITAVKLELKKEDNSLLVKLYSENRLEKQIQFSEGQDYTFEGGRLHLNWKFEKFHNAGVVVGPSASELTLGLDRNKKLIFRDEFTVVGLVYLIVPMGGKNVRDFYFDRISYNKIKPNGGVAYTPLAEKNGLIVGEVKAKYLDSSGNLINSYSVEQKTSSLYIKPVEAGVVKKHGIFTGLDERISRFSFNISARINNKQQAFSSCLPAGEYSISGISYPKQVAFDIRFNVKPGVTTYIGNFEVNFYRQERFLGGVFNWDNYDVKVSDNFDAVYEKYKVNRGRFPLQKGIAKDEAHQQQ